MSIGANTPTTLTFTGNNVIRTWTINIPRTRKEDLIVMVEGSTGVLTPLLSTQWKLTNVLPADRDATLELVLVGTYPDSPWLHPAQDGMGNANPVLATGYKLHVYYNANITQLFDAVEFGRFTPLEFTKALDKITLAVRSIYGDLQETPRLRGLSLSDITPPAVDTTPDPSHPGGQFLTHFLIFDPGDGTDANKPHFRFVDRETLIAHLGPGSVDSTALASNSVTNDKIADGAVDTDELAAGAVKGAAGLADPTDSKIEAGSIGTEDIGDGEVTRAKLETAVQTDLTNALAGSTPGQGSGSNPVTPARVDETVDGNSRTLWDADEIGDSRPAGSTAPHSRIRQNELNADELIEAIYVEDPGAGLEDSTGTTVTGDTRLSKAEKTLWDEDTNPNTTASEEMNGNPIAKSRIKLNEEGIALLKNIHGDTAHSSEIVSLDGYVRAIPSVAALFAAAGSPAVRDRGGVVRLTPSDIQTLSGATGTVSLSIQGVDGDTNIDVSDLRPGLNFFTYKTDRANLNSIITNLGGATSLTVALERGTDQVANTSFTIDPTIEDRGSGGGGGGGTLGPGAVDTAELADGAVTRPKLGNHAVEGTVAALAAGRTSKIVANSIGNADIGVGEIRGRGTGTTQRELAARTVGDEDLASNGVQTRAIQNNAVTTDKINNSSVTLAKTGGDLNGYLTRAIEASNRNFGSILLGLGSHSQEDPRVGMRSLVYDNENNFDLSIYISREVARRIVTLSGFWSIEFQFNSIVYGGPTVNTMRLARSKGNIDQYDANNLGAIGYNPVIGEGVHNFRCLASGWQTLRTAIGNISNPEREIRVFLNVGGTRFTIAEFFIPTYDVHERIPSSKVEGGEAGPFTGLTDTPAQYAASAGDANKHVAVNAAGDALVFVDPPSAGAANPTRKLFVPPSDIPGTTNARWLTLPANYRSYDTVFIETMEQGSNRNETSLVIDLIDSSETETYRSGSGNNARILTWYPEGDSTANPAIPARTFVINNNNFIAAYLYDYGGSLPNFSGNAGKFLAVNTDEDDVEFVDPPTGGGGGTVAAGVTLASFKRQGEVGDGIHFRSLSELFGGTSLPTSTVMLEAKFNVPQEVIDRATAAGNMRGDGAKLMVDFEGIKFYFKNNRLSDLTAGEVTLVLVLNPTNLAVIAASIGEGSTYTTTSSTTPYELAVSLETGRFAIAATNMLNEGSIPNGAPVPIVGGSALVDNIDLSENFPITFNHNYIDHNPVEQFALKSYPDAKVPVNRLSKQAQNRYFEKQTSTQEAYRNPQGAGIAFPPTAANGANSYDYPMQTHLPTTSLRAGYTYSFMVRYVVSFIASDAVDYQIICKDADTGIVIPELSDDAVTDEDRDNVSFFYGFIKNYTPTANQRVSFFARVQVQNNGTFTWLFTGGSGTFPSIYRVQESYVSELGSLFNSQILVADETAESDLNVDPTNYQVNRLNSIIDEVFLQAGRTYLVYGNIEITGTDEIDGALEIVWGDGDVTDYSEVVVPGLRQVGINSNGSWEISVPFVFGLVTAPADRNRLLGLGIWTGRTSNTTAQMVTVKRNTRIVYQEIGGINIGATPVF